MASYKVVSENVDGKKPGDTITDEELLGCSVEALIETVPRDKRKVYKIRPVIESVVDAGSFFEIGRLWGRSIVTGFARLDGWPVALMMVVNLFCGATLLLTVLARSFDLLLTGGAYG